MSKGSAVIAIMIAFVGGFASGNLLGKHESGDEEVANVDIAGEGQALGANAAGPSDDVERFRVPVTADQPSKGAADALVTMVIVSEFQCPFCDRVRPTVERIEREYGENLRIVWRNNPLPFHQNAGPAANLALEAFEQGGSEKFWEMHDILFSNQRALERADLERYATQVGLDMGQVRAALDNSEHSAKIEADQQLATSLGARGTPAFFINGEQLMGAQPYEKFKEVMDRQLAAARALVAAGTPQAQVYQAMTRNGLTAPAAAPAAAAAAERPAQRQPDPAAVYKLELPSGPMPQRGPDNALVTIVEFSDFQCPFCSRVEPTVNQVLEEYGNDVRVIWMNNPLPFHDNAGPAAQAVIEAFDQGGNAKFWAMHAKLFENQRALGRPELESYAQELGLNMAQFRAALDNNEHQAAITAQQAIARGFGASGTPSFFINGRNLRGAQPLQAFKAVIDQELARARALVAAGTPRAGVYAAAIRDGATEPQFTGPAAAPAAPAAAAPDADRVYEIAVPRNAPSKGARNAAVVIQEFSDFQCPFCSRVNPTMARVMQEYGDRVRVVWRNYPLPFHDNAHLAAEATVEIHRQRGDEGFWAFHDKLFENQRALARPQLEEYAGQIGGVNMAQFRAALDNRTHQAAVDADMEAVTSAGARIGTPSFFINGRLLQGAQPFEAFKTAIDRALAE
ncbi:MAG: protein-disulfide isomerase [Polyangiales bacterium]|jgi:protein-disulfide isomerase